MNSLNIIDGVTLLTVQQQSALGEHVLNFSIKYLIEAKPVQLNRSMPAISYKDKNRTKYFIKIMKLSIDHNMRC